MELPYREGSWFAVPLRQGGFGLGLVARATEEGKVIVCYFFGPRRETVPVLADARHAKASDAVRVARVGDLFLLRGQWPIIGRFREWTRSEWPIPPFVRRDPLSRKAWRVYYLDNDPSVIDREEPDEYDSPLEAASLLGAGAAELVLTKLLT